MIRPKNNTRSPKQNKKPVGSNKKLGFDPPDPNPQHEIKKTKNGGPTSTLNHFLPPLFHSSRTFFPPLPTPTMKKDQNHPQTYHNWTLMATNYLKSQNQNITNNPNDEKREIIVSIGNTMEQNNYIGTKKK